MRVHVGCRFDYSVAAPTAAVVQVEPRLDCGPEVVDERWSSQPHADTATYVDLYGNRVRRLVLPPGPLELTYDAEVDVPDGVDPVALDAEEVAPALLPDDALLYTLPSRYCLSDVLYDAAWEQFGSLAPGWGRVQAVCDFVHDHVTFGYGSSTSVTTAVDVYEAKSGVCRDFAHLAVTFWRALGIPARYVFGYLPDYGVAPPPEPMDFCAWTEVYLAVPGEEGRWWTFDPRNNKPRAGRVLIGRGRDALDVAMLTTFGAPVLNEMTVVADVVEVGVPS